MKIKKILSIISLLILCLTLSSCVTITDDEKKFVDKLYSQQIGKIEGLVIDLRTRGTEDEEDKTFSGYHISGAKSFDVNQDEDLESFMNKIAGKKVTLFIVDSGNKEYEKVVEELKELGYKKIVVYTKGYEYLRTTEVFKEAIYEGSGLDDCGCD
jgi:rhodanese-related sulfurtransferase